MQAMDHAKITKQVLMSESLPLLGRGHEDHVPPDPGTKSVSVQNTHICLHRIVFLMFFVVGVYN